MDQPKAPLITSDMTWVALYRSHDRVPVLVPVERFTATTVIVGSRPYHLSTGYEKGGYSTYKAKVAPVTPAIRDHIAAAALTQQVENLNRSVIQAASAVARRRIQLATVASHETKESAAKETIANLSALLAEYEKAALP